MVLICAPDKVAAVSPAYLFVIFAIRNILDKKNVMSIIMMADEKKKNGSVFLFFYNVDIKIRRPKQNIVYNYGN